MKRREFIKTVSSGVAAATLGTGLISEASAAYSPALPVVRPKFRKTDLKLYLTKVRQFNEDHQGDIFLSERQFQLLESSVMRFRRLQKLVGYGNFYLLDFDDAIRYSRQHTSVGTFTMAELNFLEMIFYERASDYGFYGEKPLKNLTDRIPLREVVKVPNTGNYLYKGRPLETYNKILRQVGNEVVLTSGVRSVIKQFLLFLEKAYDSQGNLSRASRSLAPPGYSFHGISDFDVGQRGYGRYNFTERFVTTEVFKKLENLGYLTLRYPKDNMLGVRFEPWHIKVNTRS
ncbi:MAG: D-alanyl-D-alanine carboxypeptidase family protein [Magnetococcales bacterium]|nr:D-alanyl-D-alanine carboxypeptidase family protein [Magnetococcales bacterium]